VDADFSGMSDKDQLESELAFAVAGFARIRETDKYQPEA